ncbi:MAG: hypothetical protein HC866_19395 [Leptolyngbyaceae cyanobacterium RU_5_1]|nr:hypothetical protein [Leptolyngbyaceae cyanobacterium RU_5_1]
MKAFNFIGLLTMTTAVTVAALTVAASTTPAIAQERICVESERDGRIVCGRRVYNNRDRFDRDDRYDRYDRDNNRYDRDTSSVRCNNFDENFYLTAYRDVAAAVSQRRVRSACEHYQQFGRFEGRFPRFNEASYLSKNPDVADAIRQRKIRSAYDHWLQYGRYENRQL